MSEPADRSECALFTIGHSNLPLETFLELLRANRIAVLADTRSQPYSRFAPHFNARELDGAVMKVGLRYLFLGKELGGRPEEAEFYDAEGYVLYGRLAESPQFLSGMAQLEAEAAQRRVAILCSEENPSVCHRRLLITRVLTARGVPVCHIRGDGRVQTEAELLAEDEAEKNRGGQQSLFDAEEVTEWKSLRSVSPRRPPPSSSER